MFKLGAPVFYAARHGYRALLRATGIVRVKHVLLARECIANYREIYPGPVFPASVINLENGRIWGRHGAVLTGRSELLEEFSIEMGRSYDHPIDYQWSLPVPEQTNLLTTVLSASMGSNYFHWMTDVLPRIHLLQKAGVDLEEIQCFVVNPIAQRFQEETLTTLGIPRWKLRETHPRLHLQPARMVVASAPGIPGNTPQWACDFLRKSFQPAKGPARSLYISRKRAHGRRVRNQSEVLAALPGFEAVELEAKTVQEQAQLFASADCVVAPHGAGLTNLLFCQPGTRVIEIFSPNYPNDCYGNLARQSGLTYSAITGKGRRISTNLVRDDITVDIPALKQML
jgi:hypothetical protein